MYPPPIIIPVSNPLLPSVSQTLTEAMSWNCQSTVRKAEFGWAPVLFLPLTFFTCLSKNGITSYWSSLTLAQFHVWMPCCHRKPSFPTHCPQLTANLFLFSCVSNISSGYFFSREQQKHPTWYTIQATFNVLIYLAESLWSKLKVFSLAWCLFDIMRCDWSRKRSLESPGLRSLDQQFI